MIKPVSVANFERKIQSLYKANIAMSAGSVVDIDTTDTTAIDAAGVGYGPLFAGSVKLFTSAALPNSPIETATQVYQRPLGIAVPSVNTTGPILIERLLDLASSYMTIAEGANLAIYSPVPGDIIATDQYVGAGGGSDHGTGWIDITSTGNLALGCEVYQGRFRLAQAGNYIYARYMGNTTANNVVLAMFQFGY